VWNWRSWFLSRIRSLDSGLLPSSVTRVQPSWKTTRQH
jgi:hypothetical protein